MGDCLGNLPDQRTAKSPGEGGSQEEGQRAVVSGKAKEQQDEAGPQGSLGAVPGT